MAKKWGSKKTHNKGHEAENRANNALYTLKFRKKIITYERSQQSDYRDRNGIDYQVFYLSNCGTKIRCQPLQVKASDQYLQNHQQKYPHVPVLIAREDGEPLVCLLLSLLGL